MFALPMEKPLVPVDVAGYAVLGGLTLVVGYSYHQPGTESLRGPDIMREDLSVRITGA